MNITTTIIDSIGMIPKNEKVAWSITLVSASLATIHIFWPALGVDAITIALVVLGSLPWLIPSLKSIELPGGVKIELKEAKIATEKIMAELPPRPSVTSTEETQGIRVRTYDANTTIEALKKVATYDPNLALVGLRIEIEKRIFALSEAHGLNTDRPVLSHFIRELQARNVLSTKVASGLRDLVNLGNKAAHGVVVTEDAASWVLEVGPEILSSLDGLMK